MIQNIEDDPAYKALLAIQRAWDEQQRGLVSVESFARHQYRAWCQANDPATGKPMLSLSLVKLAESNTLKLTIETFNGCYVAFTLRASAFVSIEVKGISDRHIPDANSRAKVRINPTSEPHFNYVAADSIPMRPSVITAPIRPLLDDLIKASTKAIVENETRLISSGLFPGI